ncbi:radical SAM protein [Sphingomonas hylomeconis]|uniref:Radical SAM protein n=1 Tax=Sphingomonas hylomeconis TaxID=1395958 RepID=A0ABV7SSX9_9SPHN|nr:radical SAM protein [Sphingomonas hylomeconis]
MEPQSAAFDRARTTLHSLGFPAIAPRLHAAGIGIDRAVLGGSHSVAVYPPIDSLTLLDPARAVAGLDFGTETSLYVHIPFCETRCTFCHYAVQHYKGRQPAGAANPAVHRYIEALKRELGLWAARLGDTTISSIYIGGGTPLVLEAAELRDILTTIRGACRVARDAEVCVEGSPLTITADGGRDKLQRLRADGVTRLSFGVQSFNDEVLRYAARGYKRDVPIRAAEIAAALFDNWNWI